MPSSLSSEGPSKAPLVSEADDGMHTPSKAPLLSKADDVRAAPLVSEAEGMRLYLSHKTNSGYLGVTWLPPLASTDLGPAAVHGGQDQPPRTAAAAADHRHPTEVYEAPLSYGAQLTYEAHGHAAHGAPPVLLGRFETAVGAALAYARARLAAGSPPTRLGPPQRVPRAPLTEEADDAEGAGGAREPVCYAFEGHEFEGHELARLTLTLTLALTPTPTPTPTPTLTRHELARDVDKFFEGDAELGRGDADLGRGGGELAQLLLGYAGAPHPRAAASPLAPRHPSADSREQAAEAEEEAAEAELGYGAGVTSEDELAPEVAGDSGDEMLIDADADATATADAKAHATADADADATADAAADAPPPCAGTKRAASSVSALELPATSRARTEEAAEDEAAEADAAEAAEAAEMQVDEEATDMPRPGTTQPTVVPTEVPRPGTHPTMQTPQGQGLQRVVQTYTVSVPAGVGPGQQFQAYLGGELADVIVPHGARPCSTLHVQIRRSVQKYAVS